jgi:hypothetical protein
MKCLCHCHEIAALKQKNEVLAKYAQHPSWCGMSKFTGTALQSACSCGLKGLFE